MSRQYKPYKALRVEVVEAWKEGKDTEGKGCQFYEVGDIFFIEQVALRRENIQTKSGMLCMAALADHIPLYRALIPYLQCHDPSGKRCLPVTSATIVFKVTRIP